MDGRRYEWLRASLEQLAADYRQESIAVVVGITTVFVTPPVAEGTAE